MIRLFFRGGVWFLLLFTGIACQQEEISKSEGFGQGWLIDSSEVMGEVNQHFPFIDEPDYRPLPTIDADSSDLVLALKAGGQVYVYPHFTMNVEVVNDVINRRPLAVTYCPLTGSGLLWNRVYDGDTLSFRASGMLYRENLMPVDTAHGSIWSQMLMQCVHGRFYGRKVKTHGLIETTWATLEQYYPEARVFASAASRQLRADLPIYVYDIRNRSRMSQDDVADGEKMLGVITLKQVHLFRYRHFNPGTRIIRYAGYLLVGNAQQRWINVFKDSGEFSFEPVNDTLPGVMVDDQGSRWDMFGYALNGEHEGMKLESPDFYVARYWAWRLFFENIRMYEED